jgi:hypothetical protein
VTESGGERSDLVGPAQDGVLGPATEQVLNLYVSATGIGDAICALYAACGAANALREEQLAGLVRLHTRHPGWFERVQHPGVEIHACDSVTDPTWIDLSRDYDVHLASATSRKQWYCDNIAPGLVPCPPQFVDTGVHVRRFECSSPYVVLAPFAAWSSRQWPVSHWCYLVALLHEAGFHAVILDGPGNGQRLRAAFDQLHPQWATWFWGNAEDWVADLLLGAAGFVGLDSGLTHFAALLGVPTVAVMAHLPPRVVFSHTRVQAVTPKTSCTFCRWQPERGYRAVCDRACSAIATVAPEQVLSALEPFLSPRYSGHSGPKRELRGPSWAGQGRRRQEETGRSSSERTVTEPSGDNRRVSEQ